MIGALFKSDCPGLFTALASMVLKPDIQVKDQFFGLSGERTQRLFSPLYIFDYDFGILPLGTGHLARGSGPGGLMGSAFSLADIYASPCWCENRKYIWVINEIGNAPGTVL